MGLKDGHQYGSKKMVLGDIPHGVFRLALYLHTCPNEDPTRDVRFTFEFLTQQNVNFVFLILDDFVNE